MKFKLLPAKNKQFYFTLIAANGQVLLTSETYTRKGSAFKTIAAINLNFKKTLPVQDGTKEK